MGMADRPALTLDAAGAGGGAPDWAGGAFGE